MRILCPFCGERDLSEFAYRGDASPSAPLDGDADEVFGHLYLRANPAGPLAEYWYHARGCRSWLAVVRDTRTHEIQSVTLAMEGGQ